MYPYQAPGALTWKVGNAVTWTGERSDALDGARAPVNPNTPDFVKPDFLKLLITKNSAIFGSYPGSFNATNPQPIGVAIQEQHMMDWIPYLLLTNMIDWTFANRDLNALCVKSTPCQNPQ